MKQAPPSKGNDRVLGRGRDFTHPNCWIGWKVVRQGVLCCFPFVVTVGSSSQADHLMRNVAMDDSIGGS